MRPAREDLTAAGRILLAAMHLFAEHGFSGTSIRDVAAAADVSSSLVVHHFKTKAALKEATDARVVTLFAQLLTELPTANSDLTETARSLAQTLADEPSLMAYVRRMLIDGGPAAEALFAGIVEATESELAAQERAGVIQPSIDQRMRAVFLIVNDLGVIILRELIEHVIGADPLSPPGMATWGGAVLEIYTRGLYAPQPQTSAPDSVDPMSTAKEN